MEEIGFSPVVPPLDSVVGALTTFGGPIEHVPERDGEPGLPPDAIGTPAADVVVLHVVGDGHELWWKSRVVHKRREVLVHVIHWDELKRGEAAKPNGEILILLIAILQALSLGFPEAALGQVEKAACKNDCQIGNTQIQIPAKFQQNWLQSAKVIRVSNVITAKQNL